MDYGFRETPRPGTVAGKSLQETPRGQEVLRTDGEYRIAMETSRWWGARVMRNLPRTATQREWNHPSRESQRARGRGCYRQPCRAEMAGPPQSSLGQSLMPAQQKNIGRAPGKSADQILSL